MKRLFVIISSASLLLALASCSGEFDYAESSGILRQVKVSVEDFADGDSGESDPLSTRAAYTVDSDGFHFSWTEGDVLGIYPVGGDQVAFPISEGEGTKSASFDGGAWALRSTYRYACYYPFSTSNYTISETALPVDYMDQSQSGNSSTSGLDSYDYMAAAATQPDAAGVISVTMLHLGCFVRLQLTMPVADTFTGLTLSSDKTPFITRGTFDLSSDTPAITSTETSKTISMSLSGISTTSKMQTITLYMMSAPVDQSGSTLTATVTGQSGTRYSATLSGKKMLARKAYGYSATFKSGTNVDGEDVGWDDDGNEQGDSQSGSTENGHEYVDLGLSVKWATCNVGASTPEGYGDYFAWGATEPYYEFGYARSSSPVWKSGKSGGYTWTNAPYQTQTVSTEDYSLTKWSKYLGSTTSKYKDASATDADALKTVLDAEDDAATANWGGTWRMPTYDELEELLNSDNCEWTWYSSGNAEYNGVAGYKVTSKKSGYTDRSIFLPACGWRYGTNLDGLGSNGSCWSSSLYTDSPVGAYFLSFYSGYYYWGSGYRSGGRTVRPVCQ